MQEQKVWAQHRESLEVLDPKTRKLSISSKALFALPYEEQIKIAYDRETPETVAAALKYAPDLSVSRAAFQRPLVLSGQLLNPYFKAQP